MDETQEPRLGLDDAVPGAVRPVRSEPYRVLARKYRPQQFHRPDRAGGAGPNAYATPSPPGRIAHAFMLTGVRGVGKTTTARIIARALNCVGPDGTRKLPDHRSVRRLRALPRHCRIALCRCAGDGRGLAHRHRRHPRDHRGHALCPGRRALQGLHHRRSAHAVQAAPSTGCLKTLEEPPPHVKFIFATTEIRKVPVTILSRCQRFDLRRIETEVLVAHLRGDRRDRKASPSNRPRCR